jgi:predicted extracellular nuclease
MARLGFRFVLGTALLLWAQGAAAQVTPIHDIQYTTDPGGGSPMVGQTVTIEGIVYGLYGTRAFAVADSSGAWNGIYVYLIPNPGTLPVDEGDNVRVVGTVAEYNGLTEINCTTAAVTVLGTGATPHPPTVVTTGEVATGAATAEQYEGVLVEVQNVLVTNPSLGYGEWQIDDSSGPTRVNDLASFSYVPVVGDLLDFVRGMLDFAFSDFKIEPRYDADIEESQVTPTPHTIAEIQGSGFVSPFAGAAVETAGVVVGFFQGNISGGTFNAFLLQDPTGDGSAETSDGLMVIAANLTGLAVGDAVTVTGMVVEYGEYDGAACVSSCMTTVFETSRVEAGTGSVAPVVLDPPTDHDGQLEYLERLEGMLVAVDGDGTVVGPTSYGTIFVVDSDLGVGRVLRHSAEEGKAVGVRHWERYGAIGGDDPPGLIVGSTATDLDGPLVTTYGDFVVMTQAGDAWGVGTSVPPPAPPPSWPAAGEGRFTVATFNAYNFDAGDADKVNKVALSVAAAGCPTVLALEEVDTASTLSGGEDDVLPALVAALASEGCPYAAASSHPDVGDHGVAALWRTDQVSAASWNADYQACSPVGSASASQYDHFCDGVPGQYPLFPRRPLLLTVTVSGSCPVGTPVSLTVVVNHFKAKGAAEDDQQRLEEAQFIAALVDTLVAVGSSRVIVAGDLNDFEDSPPLSALTAAGELRSAWNLVPAADRFSYNYGGSSQVLDHLLYSSALSGTLRDTAPLHTNADFPFLPYSAEPTVVWRTSDHDLVAASFEACSSGVFADDFGSGDTSAWDNALP